MSSPSCPTPAPSSAEITDNIPNILKMMGIQSCVSNTVAGGSIFCGCAAADTLNIGCEQISVISQKYLQTVNVSTCILNSVSNNVSGSVIANNTINITATDHASISCNKFNIDQNINIRYVSVSAVSQEIKNNIVQQIQSFIKTTIESFQKSKTGYLASPQGQKSVQDALTQVNNNINSIISNTTVTDILNNVFGSNTINITLGGYSTLSSENCKLTQNSLIDFAVQNMVQTAISNFLNQSSVTKLTTEMKNSQVSEALGPDLIGGLVGAIMVVIVLGLLVKFGGSQVKNILKYFLPILIIAGFALSIYFGVEKATIATIITSFATFICIVIQIIELNSGKKANLNDSTEPLSAETKA